MSVTKTHCAPRHYMGIRRKVPVSELMPYFAEVLPKVMNELTRRGITPTSMPMAMWHTMDMTTGVADVQAGCFVPDRFESDGEFEGGTTPATDALTLIHVGSYASMKRSWGALYQHAQQANLKPGSSWEIYIDDPMTVDEAVLRTELTLPVQ